MVDKDTSKVEPFHEVEASLKETLYLNQFSGLVDSIHKAAKEPLSEGVALKDLEL